MNSVAKIILAVMVGVIIAASAFIGGFVVSRQTYVPFALEKGGPISLSKDESVGDYVNEVNLLLQKEALEPPSETSATAAAVQALLESNGDKYGAYFDKKHYEFFNEDMAGEFGGIGVLLGEKEGTTYIVEVYQDTPAARAGIKSGDLFSVIGSVSRQKWTNEEVVKRVRGKEGTKVKLTMIRPGDNPHQDKRYTVNLTREMIQYPNVDTKMKSDDVGYIRMAQFNTQATDDIREAVKKLEEKGAKSFVLDLRDNPGGALEQAVGVSSLFQTSGVVVRVEERGKDPIEYRTTADKITDAPLVILINGNSASASEIVAGALQDYKRATLVGEKSFGKGSVQTVKETSFGGAVKFTIAHYLTPKNRVINGKGVTPDVVVKMKAEDQADDKTDAQLKKAIEEAKAAQ